mmetsp:Transcript_26820/g.40894  ORF Transcript_26820/g.40894 Transcript_26820/m.40894 type:complete len:85 (+) Transcript_26820:1178-1432(+)
MDLVIELAKKNPFRKEQKNHLRPEPTKFFIDTDGYVQFPDGSKYKGSLVDGNPEGQGTILYGDGSQYEGTFVTGNAHGFGILTF